MLHFRIPSLAGNLPVEDSVGSVFIGVQKNISDIKGECTQNDPADKGQIQNKQLQLMTVHHFPGSGDGFGSRKLRVIRHNEGGHGVAEGLDDSGDDKQQHPKKNIEACQEILGKALTKPVKLGEKVVERELFSIMLVQQVLGIAKLNGTADDKGDQAPKTTGQGNGQRTRQNTEISGGEGIRERICKFLGDIRQEGCTGDQSSQQAGYNSHTNGQRPVPAEFLPCCGTDALILKSNKTL